VPKSCKTYHSESIQAVVVILQDVVNLPESHHLCSICSGCAYPCI
jgi:hypothetical protein